MIEFRDVVATRGHRPVLDGITLTVERGEVVALVGKSGSGKTTLLKLVNCLLYADAGEVRLGGRDVRTWDPMALRRQTGYAIQEVGLFPHLTVGGNIGLVPRLLGWAPPRVASRVDELLALMDLDPGTYRPRWPDQLSGGQRQRVGLARALAADPPVLLMDEPFGALDPITRVELHRQFRALQQRQPRAVLLVTHDLAEAFALAARIAVLHEGRIVACETPAGLDSHANPHVRALMETRFG
ncbi:MAG: ATP-binding cassette domain-containing protein [Acidobacteriota bacterium]